MTAAGEPRRYTYDEVSRAVNDGASLVQGDPGIYLSDRDHDLINLVANAALSLLKEPGMSLDDVARANWEFDDDDEHPDPAQRVREWIDR